MLATAVIMQRKLATVAYTPNKIGSAVRALIIGAPGSGKGTHSTSLMRDFRMTMISSGDILRQQVNDNTALGKEAAKIMKEGGLVPDSTMQDLVHGEFNRSRHLAGLILDGYPRTVAQAQALDQHLASIDQPLDMIINLDVPDQVILERIEGRWIHKPSGRTYNTGFNPPQRAGYDDLTGEALSKRADDNVVTFRKRLETFHHSTEPMLQYYAAQDQLSSAPPKLLTFSGSTSKIIWPQIKRVCDERFAHLKRAADAPLLESAVENQPTATA